MKLQLLATLLLSLLFTLSIAQAQTERTAHFLSVGQGIASPSTISTLNLSSGTTIENPTGVMYQEGLRLTGQYLPKGTGSNTNTRTYNGYGAELGYGGRSWGIAAGSFKDDCTTCKETYSGAAALEVANSFAFGVRFQDHVYGLGGVFNSAGKFRVGFTAELNDPDGVNNNVTSYGLGMALVENDYTLAFDASTLSYENGTPYKIIHLTPGANLHVGMLQISANYRMYLNDEANIYKSDNKLWFGLGLGENSWHLAYYSNWVSDAVFEVSFFL